MRKAKFRVISVFMCLCVIFSSFVFAIIPFADTVPENIIKNSIPVIFSSGDKGSMNLNQNGIKYTSAASNDSYVGFDLANTSTKRDWSQMLATVTDSSNSADTGLFIMPKITENKIIFVYRFTKSVVNNISLHLYNSSSAAKKVTFDCYLSESFDSVFNADNIVYSVSEQSISKKSQSLLSSDDLNTSANYFAVVFSKSQIKVDEISLLGNNVAKTESEAKNIIANVNPTTFSGTKDGTTMDAWVYEQIKCSTTDMFYGYTENENPSSGGKIAKTFWLERTQKLTDDNDTTGLFIKHEKSDRKVLIVYSLDDFYNITDLKIKFSDNSNADFSLYFSTGRDELFTSKPISTIYGYNSEIYKDGFEENKVKYIGIALDNPNYSIFDIYVNAKKFESKAKGQNVIKSCVPEFYGSVNKDEFSFNWKKTYYSPSEALHGYTETDGFDRYVTWYNKLLNITDDDATTSLYVKPENANHNILLIYNVEECEIDGFSLLTDSSNQKTVKVYASKDRKKLFDSDNLIFEQTSSNNEIVDSNNLSGIDATYIGVLLEKPNYSIKDLVVNGNPKTNKENLLNTLNPYAYYGAAENSFVNNNSLLTFEDSSKVGFDKDNASTKEEWSSYLSGITDDDNTTGITLKTQSELAKRIVIIYQLPDKFSLSSFAVKCGFGLKNTSVYVSENYSELFSGEPISKVQNFNNSVFNDNISGKAKYIALVFDDADYELYGVEFYGKKVITDSYGDNLISGLIPSLYCSTDADKFEFNWTKTYYSDEGVLHGYTEKDGLERIDSWIPYLSKLTDNDPTSLLTVKPEREGKKDGVLIVYKIDDSVINGFKLQLEKESKIVIKLFASTQRSNLFSDDKLFYSVNKCTNSVTDDGTISVRAKYIGIYLETPQYAVSELEVFGNPYVRPNYGTNLIEGKRPYSLFLSERKYPLIPNGQSMISKSSKSGKEDVSVLNDELFKLTDGDFNTSVQWKPTKAKDRVDKDTRYVVTSFDLGDKCTVNKVLIDSTMTGYDIFIADKYEELFKDTSRVFTSNGDDFEGDLSSNDLDLGEQIIDIGGVSGRYLGIVVTRAQSPTVKSYEIINIAEIQVFGTKSGKDYGKNLLANKKPIMCYRASYNDYSVSLGNMSSREDMSRYTDGDVKTSAEIQFPNVSGMINYDSGALVLVYYLEGTCDIRHISLQTSYYYGIGGVDFYVAPMFADLFNKENCIYSTGGETAEDKIYDSTKNLGALGISAYPQSTTVGRYLAVVCTRICDSNVQGWATFRLREIEAFGEVTGKETLPNTTLVDSKTGSTATFEYVNPDDTFLFNDKGIRNFAIEYIPKSSYLNDTFSYSLKCNEFIQDSDVFVLKFYNSKGEVIAPAQLSAEKITLKYKLSNSNRKYISEMRKDVPYIIKTAIQTDDVIQLLVEDFDKQFIIVKPYGERVVANLSDGSVISTLYSDDDYDGFDDDYDDEISDNQSPIKKKVIRKKYVVKYSDPLDWFWDICDFYLDNPWMFAVTGLAICIVVGGIVYGIVYIKKKKRSKAL